MKKIILLSQIIISIIFAQDLIVDQNSTQNYQTDNYAKFDRFDYHGGITGYESKYPTDRILLPKTFPVLGNTFTLEAWVYSRSIPAHKTIIGDDSNPAHSPVDSPPMITLNGDLSIRYGFGTGSEHKRRTVMNIRTDNAWHHIAYSFDGTFSRLFVDGIIVDSTDIAKNTTPIQQPISILGNRLLGKIDEVRVWNIVRSNAEIQSTMNDTLDGNENGLVAYYPMDTDADWKLIDRTSNQNHATIQDAEILQRYYSNNCPSPDGSYDCPYPTVNDALYDVKAGDRILIKEGRYSELLFWDNLNDSYEAGGSRITVEGDNKNVVFDGTVTAKAEWQLSSINGHSVYKAVLDMHDISMQAGIKIDSIYGVWVDDRYMIPAMPVNFKNPTDSTTGNQDNPEPGTIWSLQYTAPYEYEKRTMPLYTPGNIANLDTLEEWSFVPETNSLYIYPGKNIPTPTNVRVRVRSNFLNFAYSPGFIFKNVHFYAGAIYFDHSDYITIEDSKFSHSWEPDLRHDELGLYWNWRGNVFHAAYYNTIRNCIFQYVVDGHPFKMLGIKYPVVENVLLRYNDWFVNTTFSPSTGNNYITKKYEDVLNDNEFAPSTWRYVTMNTTRLGGLNPGWRGLMEYIRIENQYMRTDAGGIQRTTGVTVKSTTRFSWLLNTNTNGMRFDSWCAGHDAIVHNMVSAGQKRGYRLKGDRHKIYNITGYDTDSHNISLTKIKYCGVHGSAERDSLMSNFSGRDQFNNKGNINTEVKNVVTGWSFECNSPDCGDPYVTGSEPVKILDNPEFLIKESGIWYGRSFPIDNRKLSHSFVQLEMEDPFIESRGRSDEQLDYLFGENPWKDDPVQNYDFRPKKGSSLIDAGQIVPGINDGQDLVFNHPPSYSGQNRKYIGEAPDIGPYEYGDSVYWIPGFRYEHPSVPIPRDGAKNVSPEYGLAWNYPWKTDYSGTSAIVTISGPGLTDTRTFQYPNNVMFVSLRPGVTYHWSVYVDGVSGGSWTFTTKDKVYPMNDRSLDVTIQDSVYHPIQFKSLNVKKNHRSFLRFSVPSTIDTSYKSTLSIFPEKIKSLKGGIVLYKYNVKGWNESMMSDQNIGLVNKELLTPIDTVFDIKENEPLTFNVGHYFDSSGEISFALGGLDDEDNVSFYSKEKMITDGSFPVLNNFMSGFAPQKRSWPTISFKNDAKLALQDDASVTLPKEFALHDNYPNPFNPSTTIRFDLPKTSDVSITIYNMLGQKIKVFNNMQISAGYHSITWNATNDYGNPVSAGMYLYQLKTKEFVKTKKMVLLK